MNPLEEISKKIYELPDWDTCTKLFELLAGSKNFHSEPIRLTTEPKWMVSGCVYVKIEVCTLVEGQVTAYCVRQVNAQNANLDDFADYLELFDDIAKVDLTGPPFRMPRVK